MTSSANARERRSTARACESLAAETLLVSNSVVAFAGLSRDVFSASRNAVRARDK
jgi:hypothetical protein